LHIEFLALHVNTNGLLIQYVVNRN